MIVCQYVCTQYVSMTACQYVCGSICLYARTNLGNMHYSYAHLFCGIKNTLTHGAVQSLRNEFHRSIINE